MRYPFPTGKPVDLLSTEVINDIKNEVIINLKIEYPFKKIDVSTEFITDVLNFNIKNYISKHVGNMYSLNQRYDTDYVQKIMDHTQETVYSYYISNAKRLECNKSLSVWDSVLGDFNKNGLRAHPPIKLNNKRNLDMNFNMRY